MSLKLVNKKEQFEYDAGSYQIFYRRLPTPIRGELVQQFTDKGGQTDWYKVSVAALEYSVLGWNGVEDLVDGVWVEAPYVVTLARNIPEEEQGKLLDKMGANIPSGAMTASTATEPTEAEEEGKT